MTTSSFNTQPREGGCRGDTRSTAIRFGFNTQPREGGCAEWATNTIPERGFNTQPREGGCIECDPNFADTGVSTHSRAKAAAFDKVKINGICGVSTHSRAKAAAPYIKK